VTLSGSVAELAQPLADGGDAAAQKLATEPHEGRLKPLTTCVENL